MWPVSAAAAPATARGSDDRAPVALLPAWAARLVGFAELACLGVSPVGNGAGVDDITIGRLVEGDKRVLFFQARTNDRGIVLIYFTTERCDRDAHIVECDQLLSALAIQPPPRTLSPR